MAERSKALRSGRSPLLWAWVRIPLLTFDKTFCRRLGRWIGAVQCSAVPCRSVPCHVSVGEVSVFNKAPADLKLRCVVCVCG